MPTPCSYMKLPPAREKMEAHLEALRHFELRLVVLNRDFGPDNYETVRVKRLVKELWSGLTKEDKTTYIAYMKENREEYSPEVPEEAEQERSI